MEKEQIISTLTEKLGTTQLSSRTIGTYVENNLLGEGEEYNDAYFDRHVNVLKSLQGQYSADVANRLNALKAEWEKAHTPAKDEPKPNAENANAIPTSEGNKEGDETIKKVLARMEALEKALKDAENKNATQAMKDVIKSKSGELKVANKYLWDKMANEATISENMTQEELLVKVKNAYESELKNIIGIGATPYGVSNPPNSQMAQKEMDDYFKTKFNK